MKIFADQCKNLGIAAPLIEPQKKTKLSKKPKINEQQNLANTDMRNMYFHKGKTTMPQTLINQSIVSSIADYLKTG